MKYTMKSANFEIAMSEIVEIPGVDKSHPYTTIARFVFADDKPNENGQGIQVDEFDSIAASAIGMPVKIKFSPTKGVSGHPGSIPIGVIRGMEKKTLEDGTNQLIAEAVLWADEYPTEVEYLKESFADGKAPGISWELGYKKDMVADGIHWLKGVVTRAATFVSTPAYGTRTALLALAALDEPQDIKTGILALAEMLTASAVCTECEHMADCACASCGCGDPMHNDSFESVSTTEDKKEKADSSITGIENEGGKNMEEDLKKAQSALETAKTELENTKAELAQKVQELSAKETGIAEKDAEIATLKTQLAETQKVVTTETRIRKFTEAGLKLDAEAEKAEKKKEFISSLTDAQWDEYLEEKVADLKLAADAASKTKPTAADLAAAVASQRTNFPKVGADAAPSGDIKDFMRSIARA